jgi:Na+-translocating ferredoxin:NAD+ oxidoreductase RnfG subunit
MNKSLRIMLVLLLAAALRPALGVVLLNNEAALKAMFGDATVTTEAKKLTADQLKAVKTAMGDKWTLYQSGAKAAEGESETDPINFYFGNKDGKKTGVAVMEVQPGKWGPVKYIVALDLTGKVTNAAVMSYVEQRGRPISTKRFLSQFFGKTAKDPIMVGKDIDAVSGATISSRATAFAVKKVIALYGTVYPPAKPAAEEK